MITGFPGLSEHEQYTQHDIGIDTSKNVVIHHTPPTRHALSQANRLGLEYIERPEEAEIPPRR